jgi:hypothetical protein
MELRTLPPRAVLTVALATAVGAAGAPAAIAQDSVSKVSLRKAGDTRLTLDKGAAAALESLGIKVAPLKPSAVRSGAVRFPITGGSIDPASAAGTIRHSGGLQLSKGHTTVRLRAFRIRGTALSASVGGSRANLMTLDLRRAKLSRPRASGAVAPATRVRNVSVRLSATGARALDRAFHTEAFERGLKLGTAVVTAQPKHLIVESGTTALTLDAATAGTLTNTLGLSLGVVEPAAPDAAGAIGFPIESSKLGAKLASGTIGHTGGLRLSKDDDALSLTDFDIKLGSSPTLAAAVNGGDSKADIVALDLSGAQIASRGTSLTISGVKATLNKTASDAFTATFAAPATEGATLGTAVVTAKLR